MGTVEQAIQRWIKAILVVAVFIGQHTRLQASYSVQQRHRGNFTPRKHEVPEADLDIHVSINETLVNPLVPATEQNGTGTTRPPLHGSVVQGLPNG